MLIDVQTLLERSRTLQQANKLGSYVAKRKGGKIALSHDKGHADHIYHKLKAHAAKNGHKYIDSHFDSQKTSKVHIKDLHATQSSVAWKAREGSHKLKDNEPIHVVHYKGKHYITNGHHRVIAHRLMGKTIIKAKVVHIGDDD